MKISIVIQRGVCQEAAYAGMKATHECFVVEVPDELFPEEVRKVYREMYSGDSRWTTDSITDVWLCNPQC